jgi:hypothetical protein
MSDTRLAPARAAATAINVLLLALTAACASDSRGAAAAVRTSAPTAAASAPPRPVVGYHITAATLARRISGCDPQPLRPGAAVLRPRLTDFRDLYSAASCTLRGRTALILTFNRRAEQAAVAPQLRDRVAYYATGPGWVAAPTDTSERVGQQSVVQDVALALGGLVETGGA